MTQKGEMCTVGAAPRSSGQEAQDGWHDLGQRQHVDEPSNASKSGDEQLNLMETCESLMKGQSDIN